LRQSLKLDKNKSNNEIIYPIHLPRWKIYHPSIDNKLSMKNTKNQLHVKWWLNFSWIRKSYSLMKPYTITTELMYNYNFALNRRNNLWLVLLCLLIKLSDLHDLMWCLVTKYRIKQWNKRHIGQFNIWNQKWIDYVWCLGLKLQIKKHLFQTLYYYVNVLAVTNAYYQSEAF
jgi:hypothetical protein